MRRTLIRWLVAAALAAIVGAVAVVVLGLTVFGPSSLVRSYLDALARGDATGALQLPGVTADGATSTALLDDAALSGLRDLREVSVVPGPDGTTLVTYAWRSPTGPGETTFSVEPVGRRLGVFPEWGFAESPLAVVRLAVRHDPRFTVNGMPAETGLDSGDPGAYAVLAPGDYVFDHESEFLGADAVTVTVDEAIEVDAALEVRPEPTFAAQAQLEVDEYLDVCATQEVLFPTGCPFGQPIANRVVSTPRWSIVAHPVLTVQPSEQFGVWAIPSAGATAHLVVDVQSIFDGTVSTFDQDVPFTVRYLVTIEPVDSEHDELRISPQGD